MQILITAKYSNFYEVKGKLKDIAIYREGMIPLLTVEINGTNKTFHPREVEITEELVSLIYKAKAEYIRNIVAGIINESPEQVDGVIIVIDGENDNVDFLKNKLEYKSTKVNTRRTKIGTKAYLVDNSYLYNLTKEEWSWDSLAGSSNTVAVEVEIVSNPYILNIFPKHSDKEIQEEFIDVKYNDNIYRCLNKFYLTYEEMLDGIETMRNLYS